MHELTTPSGKPFRYKEYPAGEIIIYPSDKEGRFQEREALVITPYTVNLICHAIQEKGRVFMGASRDNPPASSLGKLLKNINQSPQQLSYLTAILAAKKVCTIEKDGNAYVIVHRRP